MSKLKSSLAKLAAPFSVILGSVAGLATTIIAPRTLPAAEFVVLSTALALGQFISTTCYEWLKQSVLRFGNSSSCASSELANRRNVLSGGYFIVSLTLLAVGGILLPLGSTTPLALSVAVFYAVAQGYYDGVQAWARARLRNFSFSILWIIRASVLLLTVFFVGRSTNSGAFTVATMSGLLLGCALFATKYNGDTILSPPSVRQLRELSPYLNFGIFAALSTALTVAIQPVVRMVSGGLLDAESAGGLILAIDIFYKVLSIAGFCVNVIVSQVAYRRIDAADRESRIALYNLQIAVPLLFILPGSFFFYFVQRHIVQFISPPNLRDTYLSVIALVSIGTAAACIRLYCIDPTFLLAGRARLAIISPILAILLFLALAFAGHLACGKVSVEVLAMAYAGSALTSTFFSAALVRSALSISLPLRHIAVITAATVAAALLSYLCKPQTMIGLMITVAAAGTVYVCLVAAIEGRAIRAIVSEIRG